MPACEECGKAEVTLKPHDFAENSEGVYCCTICKYEPECKGEHWVITGATHASPACDKCGFAGLIAEEELHTWSEDEAFACTVCGYDPECGGVHEMVNDDPSGHYIPECDECGAEEVKKKPHTYTDDEEYKCTECEFDPECNGVHTYTYDDNGHSMNECEDCGAEAIDAVAHTYLDVVENGVHTAKCFCGSTKTTTVPDSVEAYHNAQIAVNTAVAGHKGSMDKEYAADGNGFVRFDNLTFTDAKAGDWPWARLNVVNDENGIEGVRYVVFKYRFGAENATAEGAKKATYMSCFASTEYMSGKMPPATDTLNTDIIQDGQWHTVVIDLCRTGKVCVADENGTINLKLFQITPLFASVDGGIKQWMKDPSDPTVAVSAWTAESFFDIEYVAFCDQFGDLKDVIDQDSYMFRMPGSDTTTYTYSTSDIGDTAPTEKPEPKKDIPDSVALYNDAKALAVAGTTSFYSIKAANRTAMTATLNTDEGGFIRLSAPEFPDTSLRSDWPYITYNIITDTTDGGGIAKDSAKYVVFKYRIGADNTPVDGATAVSYINCLAGNTQWVSGMNAIRNEKQQVKVTQDGQWHTVVVDLSTFNTYNSGTANLTHFWIEPFIVNSANCYDNQFVSDSKDTAATVKPAWQDGAYMDFAYVSVFSNYADLAAIIDQDTYDFNGVSYNTSDIGTTAPTT